MRTGDRLGQSRAYCALALASALETHPDWSKVEGNIQEGLQIARELGAWPNLAIGYYHYASILRAKGDLARAVECIDKASEIFSELDMPWWLEQTAEFLESMPSG